LDSSELASAAKFSDEEGQLGVSRFEPDVVATQLHNNFMSPAAVAAR
jgi:hypothetical protein